MAAHKVPAPKAAAKELAQGLIKLYAERSRQEGYAFPPDSPWQAEFEERFGFEETDDQLRCIQEIKRTRMKARAHGPPALRRRGATARPRSPCAPS